MTEILKAKPVTRQIYSQIRQELAALTTEPTLALVMIGHDPAAQWYVNNLVKQGSKNGLKVLLHKFDEHISQQNLLAQINDFNLDNNISGIMLQKPLPSHLQEEKVVSAISPQKDVDGFHPVNLGKLMLQQKALLPCTPQAVLEILKFYQIQTGGRDIVIAGRSNIVGKPLANLLLQKSPVGNATVTVCHSHTENLEEHCRRADILIAALGKAHFFNAEMIKENAVVIDVGTNQIKNSDGSLAYTGDVDYEAVFYKVKAITPVPGGVGSVTTAMLLRNVLFAHKIVINKKIY